MIKLDINGNTVATNRQYLLSVLRNIGLSKYEFDSYGLVMIPTADGGQIRFYMVDEPFLASRLGCC
jgi:hypothetical protein